MKKYILVIVSFFFYIVNLFGHSPCPPRFYIADKYPYMIISEAVTAEEVESIEFENAEYAVSYYVENDTTYSSNCEHLKKDLKFLNERINTDLNLNKDSLPTYIINDNIIDFKIFSSLISNVELKQVRAFLIVEDCIELQKFLEINVSNGFVMIYTR